MKIFDHPQYVKFKEFLLKNKIKKFKLCFSLSSIFFTETKPFFLGKNKSCMDFQSVLSIDDYIDNINDKSCLIKSKNDIDQINQDLTTFLDLNQVVQFRYNDKVSKYYFINFQI